MGIRVLTYIRCIGDSDTDLTASADGDVVIGRTMGVLREQYGCDAAGRSTSSSTWPTATPASVLRIAASIPRKRNR